MTLFDEQHEVPDDFSGTARLFPLPSTVIFPHVVQQLHIFEPRYVSMLEDALQGDQLIAMSLLASGWEADYEGRPPIEPVACLGKVIVHARNASGTHNIILLGLQRAEIITELAPDQTFRQARVNLMVDRYSALGAARRPALQRRLLQTLEQHLPKTPAARDQFQQLQSEKIPLGPLTDILASTVRLPLAIKLGLLAECDVDRRAQLLLVELDEGDGDILEDPFPPPFSLN